MMNLEVLLNVSEIGGKSGNQDRKVVLSDAEHGMGLMIVADGVGGSNKGDVAAQIVIDTFSQLWEKRNEFSDPQVFLNEAAERANLEIKKFRNKSLPTASTLAAIAFWPGKVVSVHAGDSRIYQFGTEGLIKHSRDHSLAYSKYLLGEIKKEELATHPTQTQLLSCMDGGDTTFEFTEWSLSEGKHFIVCTDGFWEVYNDDELHELIGNADRKMAFINHFDTVLEQRPKHDNTTALIAAINLTDNGSSRVSRSDEIQPQSSPVYYGLIGLLAIILLVFIYFLVFAQGDNEQINNDPVSKPPVATKQGESAAEKEKSKPSENKPEENSDDSDASGHGQDDNSENDSESSNSESDDESTDTSSTQTPKPKEGLDSVDGMNVEVDFSKNIKQQITDALKKNKIIDKDSEVIVGDEEKDQYATIRNLKLTINGIPVYGAEAKLLKTDSGFEIVTGQLANIKAPAHKPVKSFDACLTANAQFKALESNASKPVLFIDAKTGGYLWQGDAEKIEVSELYRVLFFDADCSIKLSYSLVSSDTPNKGEQ